MEAFTVNQSPNEAIRSGSISRQDSTNKIQTTSSALVTGGSGYFGSLLVEKLLKKNFSCSILDTINATDRPSNVNLFQCDIRDAEAVNTACLGVDVIYHCVAQVPLAKNKELFDSVNIQGTENILAAALANRVKKVVYVSSSSIFGVPEKNPVTETDKPKPLEAYGKAKLVAESLCKDYIDRRLDVSIIRPRTMLGHGRLGIFQILFEWVRQGHNIPVLGKGNNLYQFVHSDDLAEACILAANRPGAELYNCGTDRFGSMRGNRSLPPEKSDRQNNQLTLDRESKLNGSRITMPINVRMRKRRRTQTLAG